MRTVVKYLLALVPFLIGLLTCGMAGRMHPDAFRSMNWWTSTPLSWEVYMSEPVMMGFGLSSVAVMLLLFMDGWELYFWKLQESEIRRIGHL